MVLFRTKLCIVAYILPYSRIANTKWHQLKEDSDSTSMSQAAVPQHSTANLFSLVLVQHWVPQAPHSNRVYHTTYMQPEKTYHLPWYIDSMICLIAGFSTNKKLGHRLFCNFNLWIDSRPHHGTTSLAQGCNSKVDKQVVIKYFWDAKENTLGSTLRLQASCAHHPTRIMCTQMQN